MVVRLRDRKRELVRHQAMFGNTDQATAIEGGSKRVEEVKSEVEMTINMTSL